ncbi:LLM class flavin-dependent oxidoreductase [Yinghuangia soli]|uniref:LLM class flavin-dependent oxidoreductase n=1 Tax=Yinghuangia soli TaxID=2908204 RepID=A0AA41PWB7_9ACTN|nr:LLM class flavin-dependent oxidoreductase [Yinghuangia soli]MCF2526490.1 LLM class flavin-dependent oxidoreductase [Yinghuangia soli]
MTRLRITYGPWGETLDELCTAGAAAEAAGAEVLWVPELHRSATVTAAALAARTSSARIGTGIAQSGRTWNEFDVVVSARCSIDDDRAAVRRRAAGLVGFCASVRTYADLFAAHGLSAAQEEVIRQFRAGAGADDLAAAVPAPMVDALTLSGPAAEVRERVLAYEGIAGTVKLTPPTHGLPAPEIRAAQQRILALIAELTGERS